MNTFDVKKRSIFSYEEFLKDSKKAEDAKHTEKGENDIVKKSMAGEVEGKKGYATLAESLSKEALDRMEGLAHIEKLKQFNELLSFLTKEWLEEGFDKKDIIDYIMHLLSLTRGM